MSKLMTQLKIISESEADRVIVETSDEDFGQEILNHIQQFPGVQRDLHLKTAKGIEIVQQADIIFLEVFQREMVINRQLGKTTIRMPLKKMLTYLDPASFVQVSKSIVINLRCLQKLEVAFSGNYYAYLGNQRVVISRRYLKNLKERLNLIGGEKNENC